MALINKDYKNYKSILNFTDKIFYDYKFSDFIEKTNALFNTDGNLIAVTRRFGKTITAHMLSAHYSKGYADQKILDNPEISTKKSSNINSSK